MSVIDVLASYIKIVHVFVIVSICQEICTPYPHIDTFLFTLELGLTVAGILISKKHFLDHFQIIFSLNLSYTLIPNNYSFLAGLFFCKIIYVCNVLGEAHSALFEGASTHFGKLVGFLFNISRYTIVQYLFFGLIILGYKVSTLGDKEELPDDEVILYQLIVTATTIGYGDVCPRPGPQMRYFTYAIPAICLSFVFYGNAVVPIINELLDFLMGNTSNNSSNSSSGLSNSKVWSSSVKADLVNFAEQVAAKQAEHDQEHARVGHNWIAIAANHYEKQIPLISSILRGDEGKEVQLKVASKVRRQHYPKNWTIINAGECNEDLMMVDEGEVKVPELQKAGYVFNREGFASRGASPITVVTSSFVTLWAISLKDLQELAKSSSKIQALLKEDLS